MILFQNIPVLSFNNNSWNLPLQDLYMQVGIELLLSGLFCQPDLVNFFLKWLLPFDDPVLGMKRTRLAFSTRQSKNNQVLLSFLNFRNYVLLNYKVWNTCLTPSNAWILKPLLGNAETRNASDPLIASSFNRTNFSSPRSPLKRQPENLGK